MIKLAVISGKGGTGKTMLTASLASLIPGDKVLIDADVDAANLALLLDPINISEHDFLGMEGAVIDQEKCINCGNCATFCVFDAVLKSDEYYTILPYKCEGCTTCTLVCPESAIEMKPRVTGVIYEASSKKGKLIYGSLKPGSGNSGLMVHKLRQITEKDSSEISLLLIDGPPGIGCSLMSTITGMDAVLIVTEPGRSALHDLMRLLKVCRSFRVKIFLVINRYDISKEIADEINRISERENIHILGSIPYDPLVVTAIRRGIPASDMEGNASKAIHQIAKNLINELKIYDNSQ